MSILALMMKAAIVISLIISTLSFSLNAEEKSALRLAAVFNDGMVVQRDVEVPIWGWAAANSSVAVEFAGQTVNATADAEGYWLVRLAAMPANAEAAVLKVSSDVSEVSVNDVYVGEVWLCAGQSNMNAGGPNKNTGYYPFYESPEGADDIAPVRLVRYGWGGSITPLTDNTPGTTTHATWRDLKIERVSKSTNTPEQFARILRDRLQVPVGILHVAVSGTNQAAWMHRKTLESFPSKKFDNFFEEFKVTADKRLAKDKNLKTWEGYEAAYAKWLENPKGRSPANAHVQNYPTALYNTRIHPLAPYAIKGVIWHQGEAGPGGPYGERLVAMAKQWREHFGQDFYFLFGTLTRTSTASPTLVPAINWFYRSGTNRSIKTAIKHWGDDKKAAMVDFYDLGDYDTHWMNKAESGRRMALAALEMAYGKDQPAWSGPRMTGFEINGANATVSFTHVGEGISYAPSYKGISGVVVKSAKGEWVWAEVSVAGKDSLTITHPQGEEIASFGYAMNPNPHETIFNSEGIPGTPFEHELGTIPYHPKPPNLIEVEGEKQGRGRISLTHFREKGLVFEMISGKKVKKDLTTTIKVKLPEAWADSAEVLVNGAAQEFSVVDGEHGKEAHFQMQQKHAWVVICQMGSSEEFVNIKRY